MINNELIMTSALALITGFILGVIFFGGLWWTIQKALTSNNPTAWFLCSLLLRTAITLFGFYLIGHGHLDRLLISLLGFVIARFTVSRFTRVVQKPDYLAKDNDNAS